MQPELPPKYPDSRKAPRRGGLLFLSLLLLPAVAAGCWRNDIVIPDQITAREQFEFANRLYREYESPFVQQSKERDRHARIALAGFQRVLDRFPREKTFVGRSRLGIALIWKMEGRGKRALRMLEEIVKDYPDDDFIQIHALFETGNLLDDMGRHREAKNRFREILERYGGTQIPELQTIVLQSHIKYQKVWGK